jgi:hypothetical protein
VFGWTVSVPCFPCVVSSDGVGVHSSAYLRQTIMLSSYETPQTRAFFNNTKLLKNVAGRVRQARQYGAAPIPEGITTVSSV